MTFDVSHWSATASNWTIAIVIVLTLFAFYAARAGQPLFGSEAAVPGRKRRRCGDDRAFRRPMKAPTGG
jgi:hypothetical protein